MTTRTSFWLGPVPAGASSIAPARSYLLNRPAPGLQPSRWIDGHAASVSALKGRAALVTFWATWCGPCIAEFPQVERLFREVKGRGATVIALSPADNDAAALKAILTRQEAAFPSALDTRASAGYGETFARYHISSLPAHVVIDRAGIVRYNGHDLEAAERAIHLILADQKN